MSTDTGWDAINRATESKFIKWNEGPFELRFKADPPAEVRTQHWQGGRPVECLGPDLCTVCQQYRDTGNEDLRPKKTVLFHVEQLTDDGEWIDRLFDMSMTAVRELKITRDRLGPAVFEKSVIYCAKRGSGPSTRYTFERSTGGAAARKVRNVPSPDNDDIPF